MNTSTLTIAIDEIPAPGLVLSGELPAEWVDESALPAYTVASPLQVSLEVKRLGDTIHVAGRLSVDLTFACSRTLAPGRMTLDVPFSELYKPAATHAVNLGEGVETDLLEDEPYSYEGRTLELEPLVREHLVLSQDPYPIAASAETGPQDADSSAPLWSSREDIDPRWAKLKALKLP